MPELKRYAKLLCVALAMAVVMVITIQIGVARTETKVQECMADGDTRALCEAIILRRRF